MNSHKVQSSNKHATMKRPLLFLLAPIFFLSFGCTDDPGEYYTTRRDSAGIEIVEHGKRDRILSWRFEEEFRLGGQDIGPEAFYRVSPYNVQADSLGRIYIKNEARVSAFSPSGEFLWAAGNEGGGPGEIRYPGPIAVTPSGIVGVYDHQGAKLVQFNSEGGVLAPFTFPAFRFDGAIHRGHSILVFGSRVRKSEETIIEDRLLAFVDDTLLVIASRDIAANRIRPRDCGIELGGRPPVFTPEIEWTAAYDYVAVAKTAEYMIDVFEEGASKRTIRRAIDPPAATEAAGLREMGGGITVGMAGSRGSTGQRVCSGTAMLEARGMAEVIPVIKRMAMAPDGALWVEWRRDDEATSTDVFDSDGEYLGTLPEDSPFPVLFLPENRIGAALRDDNNVDRLVIYRVVIGES